MTDVQREALRTRLCLMRADVDITLEHLRDHRTASTLYRLGEIGRMAAEIADAIRETEGLLDGARR